MVYLDTQAHIAQSFCTTSLCASYGLGLTTKYLIQVLRQKYKTDSTAFLFFPGKCEAHKREEIKICF